MENLKFLLKPATWIAAYTQVFFSLSVGFGIMFAYGSFLQKETNIVRNAFLIAGGGVLSPLFFFMFLLLGVDSAFPLVEGVIKAFEDKFGWSHRTAMAVVCSAGFLLGVPFMFSTGLFWFDTLDHFMNHFGLVLACLFECLVFGRVVEFYAGWLMLIALGGFALLFTLAKGSEKAE